MTGSLAKPTIVSNPPASPQRAQGSAPLLWVGLAHRRAAFAEFAAPAAWTGRFESCLRLSSFAVFCCNSVLGFCILTRALRAPCSAAPVNALRPKRKGRLFANEPADFTVGHVSGVHVAEIVSSELSQTNAAAQYRLLSTQKRAIQTTVRHSSSPSTNLGRFVLTGLFRGSRKSNRSNAAHHYAPRPSSFWVRSHLKI